MDRLNLNSFLRFGYFLKFKNPDIVLDFSGIDKEKYSGLPKNELIKSGGEILFNAVRKNFKDNRKHLLPLSGGLDSRAILACLSELTELSNIQTFTFGTPGTLDYEIGKLISKKTGTKHVSFDLTGHTYTEDEEIFISKNSFHQTFLFHHPPWLKILDSFSGHDYWSGYIGDWIAGSYLRENPSGSVEEAISSVSEKEKFVISTELNDESPTSINRLFELDNPLPASALSYEEQIEAKNKLVKNTAPNILVNCMNNLTPLIEKGWVDFMLSLENKHRSGENLFMAILLDRYRKLFEYPAKNTFGLPLNASKTRIFLKRLARKSKQYANKIYSFSPNRYINYIDFGRYIREKTDLKNLIVKSISDLKNRNIIVRTDPGKILKNHLDGKKNHADALIVLASLELHLKAGKVL